MAWSAGKQAFVRAGKDAERTLELPSTPGGLAFAPKGLRLAIAHYNGVTLWFPNAQTEPERLDWKGSHLGVTVSPDGQIPGHHHAGADAARLAARRRARTCACRAIRRACARSAGPPGGKWLATSGSNQLMLWPFQAKDGPMGKQPRILAPMEPQIEVVACHPKQDVVAVGYADGLVLIVRIEDGAEVLARKPGGAAGQCARLERLRRTLAFGTEDGDAGVSIALG